MSFKHSIIEKWFCCTSRELHNADDQNSYKFGMKLKHCGSFLTDNRRSHRKVRARRTNSSPNIHQNKQGWPDESQHQLVRNKRLSGTPDHHLIRPQSSARFNVKDCHITDSQKDHVSGNTSSDDYKKEGIFKELNQLGRGIFTASHASGNIHRDSAPTLPVNGGKSTIVITKSLKQARGGSGHNSNVDSDCPSVPEFISNIDHTSENKQPVSNSSVNSSSSHKVTYCVRHPSPMHTSNRREASDVQCANNRSLDDAYHEYKVISEVSHVFTDKVKTTSECDIKSKSTEQHVRWHTCRTKPIDTRLDVGPKSSIERRRVVARDTRRTCTAADRSIDDTTCQARALLFKTSAARAQCRDHAPWESEEINPCTCSDLVYYEVSDDGPQPLSFFGKMTENCNQLHLDNVSHKHMQAFKWDDNLATKAEGRSSSTFDRSNADQNIAEHSQITQTNRLHRSCLSIILPAYSQEIAQQTPPFQEDEASLVNRPAFSSQLHRGEVTFISGIRYNTRDSESNAQLCQTSAVKSDSLVSTDTNREYMDVYEENAPDIKLFDSMSLSDFPISEPNATILQQTQTVSNSQSMKAPLAVFTDTTENNSSCVLRPELSSRETIDPSNVGHRFWRSPSADHSTTDAAHINNASIVAFRVSGDQRKGGVKQITATTRSQTPTISHAVHSRSTTSMQSDSTTNNPAHGELNRRPSDKFIFESNRGIIARAKISSRDTYLPATACGRDYYATGTGSRYVGSSTNLPTGLLGQSGIPLSLALHNHRAASSENLPGLLEDSGCVRRHCDDKLDQTQYFKHATSLLDVRNSAVGIEKRHEQSTGSNLRLHTGAEGTMRPSHRGTRLPSNSSDFSLNFRQQPTCSGSKSTREKHSIINANRKAKFEFLKSLYTEQSAPRDGPRKQQTSADKVDHSNNDLPARKIHQHEMEEEPITRSSAYLCGDSNDVEQNPLLTRARKFPLDKSENFGSERILAAQAQSVGINESIYGSHITVDQPRVLNMAEICELNSGRVASDNVSGRYLTSSFYNSASSPVNLPSRNNIFDYNLNRSLSFRPVVNTSATEAATPNSSSEGEFLVDADCVDLVPLATARQIHICDGSSGNFDKNNECLEVFDGNNRVRHSRYIAAHSPELDSATVRQIPAYQRSPSRNIPQKFEKPYLRPIPSTDVAASGAQCEAVACHPSRRDSRAVCSDKDTSRLSRVGLSAAVPEPHDATPQEQKLVRTISAQHSLGKPSVMSDAWNFSRSLSLGDLDAAEMDNIIRLARVVNNEWTERQEEETPSILGDDHVEDDITTSQHLSTDHMNADARSVHGDLPRDEARELTKHTRGYLDSSASTHVSNTQVSRKNRSNENTFQGSAATYVTKSPCYDVTKSPCYDAGDAFVGGIARMSDPCRYNAVKHRHDRLTGSSDKCISVQQEPGRAGGRNNAGRLRVISASVQHYADRQLDETHRHTTGTTAQTEQSRWKSQNRRDWSCDSQPPSPAAYKSVNTCSFNDVTGFSGCRNYWTRSSPLLHRGHRHDFNQLTTGEFSRASLDDHTRTSSYLPSTPDQPCRTRIAKVNDSRRLDYIEANLRQNLTTMRCIINRQRLRQLFSAEAVSLDAGNVTRPRREQVGSVACGSSPTKWDASICFDSPSEYGRHLLNTRRQVVHATRVKPASPIKHTSKTQTNSLDRHDKSRYYGSTITKYK